MDDINQKLIKFSNLHDGWHYGEGISIPISHILIAAELIDYIRSICDYNMDLFPGLSGELRITIYDNLRYFEITIENEISFTYLYEFDEREVDFLENISKTKIYELIRDFPNVK